MKKILAIGLICCLMPTAYADLTQEQAREKARVFLFSLNKGVGINDLLQRNSRRESDNTLIWPFFCNNGAIRVNIDSTTGEVVSFDDRELALRNEERFKNKEAPIIRSAAEAREKADAMLHKLAPSFNEFQPVVQISTSGWTSNGGFAPTTVKSIDQLIEPGYWSIKYKRLYNTFEVFGDNCTVWLDLYEGRPIFLRFNSRTPVCETVQNVTREEAIRLTLDGMKQRGLSAVVSFNNVYPRLAILRPNYCWTDYAIPSGSAPFTRLAWIIQVNAADNSTLGIVYIDAASGEWLGGDTVAGKRYPLKTVPPQANALAFIFTQYIRL
ncbi:MAG: hypothetical protein IT210_00960 [Armatimonadetes bacterium]|nr:hypothetical protein [Armatimonadota bacterium]